ncbi:MAG: CPBP family intramembrane metalloprotease [Clostridiales bacterium]|nr:CPBP family intramembrane metalloprotease [Clostridiales bacterium]
MENNTKHRKSPFARFHTPWYSWHDNIIIIILIFLALLIITAILDSLFNIPMSLIADPENGALEMFLMYFSTIVQWVVFLGYPLLLKKDRPMVKALTPKAKGNNIKMFLIGLLLGGGQNALCILFAVLHGDVHLVFDSFKPLPLIAILIAVFIQSSSEELMCRNFLYQRLARGHKSPLVPILGNSLIFMALHLMNPGISAVPIIHLVAIAVLYSLFVYYFDSIWLPMAAHTAWNYTQNIIFGLPNSGIVPSFSIFRLEASTATSNFIYDPSFGVEGAPLALLFTVAIIVVTIILGRKYKEKEPLKVWG